MSTDPPDAMRRAAALLAADARRFEPVSRANAGAAVDATARAIRARVVRRARRRWALGIGAAAAAVVAVAGASRVLRPSEARPAVAATGAEARGANGAAATPSAVLASVHGSVLAVSGGETSRVVDGRAAKAGDRFVALQDGSAALTLPSGTRLTLEGGGDLVWLEQGSSHVFGVAAGAVRADVAKLSPGERFVLRTDDAEVEVRGTSFRVARAPSQASCGGGTTTRVEVFEGIVAVRAGNTEAHVAAGEEWPAACDGAPPGIDAPLSPSSRAPEAHPSAAPRATIAPSDSAAPSSRAAAPTATAGSRAPASSAAGRAMAASAAAARASDLAAQNDLFDEALAAERRGDAALALATLERFERRYPTSPLAESALAARMKILRPMDRMRARDAARAYLQRYPSGFARADAQAVLESEASP